MDLCSYFFILTSFIMKTQQLIDQKNFETLFENLRKEGKIKSDKVTLDGSFAEVLSENLGDIGGCIQDGMFNRIKKIIYYKTEVGYFVIVATDIDNLNNTKFNWYLDNSLMDLEFGLKHFHKFLRETYINNNTSLEFWIGDNLAEPDQTKPVKNIIHHINKWLSRHKTK